MSQTTSTTSSRYFLTGVKTGEIAPPENRPHRVPINVGDLQKIAAFAQGKGALLTNPNTLAIVVKSAWIETTGLDQDNYVTIDATVPTFDTTDPARWTRNGQKQARLALVGMHIVASVRNEPSMVWATFEHVANTPITGYAYLGATGQSILVDPAANPAGAWHFSATNCAGTFNQPRMRERNRVIEGVNGQTIGPSDTCRVNAWGTPSDTAPHSENNTRIVDVNRNSIGKLANDDVRKNYLLVGATWNFRFGARVLANTTLETFTQHSTCFDCHAGNLTDGLNRIWKRVKPLR